MNNNWQKQYIVLSWDHFQHLVFKLAQKIKRSTRKFDLIVTIARGGLALSQILSDILNLPVAAFTAQSYFDLKQQKIPQVTYGLATSLTGKRVLLADEVCDTGKTFLKGIEYLQSLQVKKQDITTCCLHYKLHAVYQPDFYVDRTSKWIIICRRGFRVNLPWRVFASGPRCKTWVLTCWRKFPNSERSCRSLPM